MADSPTPSSKKKDGSNKRTLERQNGPPPPPQPNPNRPEASRSDGNATPNPNNNPPANVIPRSASRELQDKPFELKKIETQSVKAQHHIIFLTSAIDEGVMLNGLAWNVTVNVMQPNNEINKEIKEHIQTSVTGLMEILRSHYNKVEGNLDTRKQQLEEEINKLKTSENEQLIVKKINSMQVLCIILSCDAPYHVTTANCYCTAGKSGICSHVVGLLKQLINYVNDDSCSS